MHVKTRQTKSQALQKSSLPPPNKQILYININDSYLKSEAYTTLLTKVVTPETVIFNVSPEIKCRFGT